MKLPLKRVLFATGLSLVVAALACSKQGEGARCDRRAENNGNADCNDGLVCTAPENLNGTIIAVGESNDEGRCCPADRSTATERICQQATGGIGSDSGNPTNFNDASPDGSTDSATDAATTPDTAVADADDAG